jgi:ABC-2 type transport system permease protein
VAVLYHAAFDFVAVFGASQIENIWLLEGVLALMAVPLIIWVRRLRPRDSVNNNKQIGSLIPEINVFVVSLRKEMLFQWRTRRVIIIGAIFLLFGMVSPLLAKFTPALLGSLEGAEQLADIIPEPTAEVAIGQYIKNLTQFGFILAILMGMGSIAGEKEKGTAAMILSKPMPRWAFITSKFVSQAFVYSIGFILAMFAAYYYTVFLFGPIDFFAFSVVNILLFVWLLVFVAVTIFGSTVGRTIGAAAGVALVGSVLILLASSIPRYGALAPGGLVAWAGQLLIGNETIPNGGSVALSLVLILVALIAALAVFEEQEV